MRLVGYMTPTGYQYPPPESGPRAVTLLDIDVPHSIIHTRVDFADTGPPTPVPPGSPCSEIWPSKGSRLYVVAGDKIIGNRDFPPPTCSTITDDWPAPSQVVQAIVANPSNAILYVEAPPNTLPREYLPAGVVLNGASPWARLQPPPPSDSGANL